MFGQIFVIPEIMTRKHGARIAVRDDPGSNRRTCGQTAVDEDDATALDLGDGALVAIDLLSLPQFPQFCRRYPLDLRL